MRKRVQGEDAYRSNVPEAPDELETTVVFCIEPACLTGYNALGQFPAYRLTSSGHPLG